MFIHGSGSFRVSNLKCCKKNLDCVLDVSTKNWSCVLDVTNKELNLCTYVSNKKCGQYFSIKKNTKFG